MPQKIGFYVTAVSGEDEKFPAEDLNIHGPTVHGWRTSRFCSYPQELVIRLDSRTHICKIQILSHQFHIASQVELFVADPPEDVSAAPSAQYKRLGYVSLSDNEKTNYRARELKSINVNAVGSFIKFIINKNHINSHNLFNQVGIVAINVIGDPIDNKTGSKSFELKKNPSTTNAQKDTAISPLDDLIFDMYQDHEVAQIIRKLDAKKQEAVRAEKYEFAKKLKVAISELFKAGEKLGKFEVEKKQAIEMEDYDKARSQKTQMEEYRLHIYESIRVHELLDTKAKDLPHSSKVTLDQKPVVPKRSFEIVDFQDHDSNNPSEVMESSLHSYSNVTHEEVDFTPTSRETTTNESLQRSKPIINSYVAYDERALPAIRGMEKSDPYDESIDSNSKRKSRKKQNMDEQDKRQMALPIEIFGLETVINLLQHVEKFFSKMFSHREESLKEIKQQILDFESNDPYLSPAQVVKAGTIIIQKALKDVVGLLSIILLAFDLIQVLLCDLPKKHKIPKAEIANTVEKTLPELITKLGDKAIRIREAAHEYILKMVDYPEVRALQLVPVYCCQSFASNVLPRMAQAQALLVEKLVDKLGIDKTSGMSVSMVMGFAVPALQHSSGPVREIAERIIIKAYRLRGKDVRKYLPSDDERIARNTLYRHLFEELSHIDAKEKKRASVIINLSGNGDDNGDRRNSILSGLSSPQLENLEKTCIFCGERSDSFTNEGLDMHYWKFCPMLTRCNKCKQVVEVSGLTVHLLTECAMKDQYAKCHRCQEAINREDYDNHVKLKLCSAAKSLRVAQRCPLCHGNILPGESGWKKHLMGINGCKSNPRGENSQKQGDKMKKSQSADRALYVARGESNSKQAGPSTHQRRMSRSTSRNLQPPNNPHRKL